MTEAIWLQSGAAPGLEAQDAALIRLLQADGRMSFVDAAAALGSTPAYVRRRVAELKAGNVIDISIVADPALLGYRSLALVGLKLAPGVRRRDVAARLFALTAVDYAVTGLGAYDVLVELVCPDLETLGQLLDDEVRALEGVREAALFPYLRLHYQQPVWDRARAKPGQPGLRPALTLDVLDRQLIELLGEDGRMAFVELARRCDVSEAQVRKRYARLMETGAMQVLALVNPRTLGYALTAWLCIGIDGRQSYEAVADHLAAVPSVAYVAICTGGFDIMAELVVQDTDELGRILDGTIRKIAGIGRIETLLVDHCLYRRLPIGG